MTTSIRTESATCHVCKAAGLVVIPAYQQLSRSTSDCKVWPAGGQLGFCPNCGCAQAILDARWHQDADAIYSNYQIYHQAAGAEQSVFDAVTGQPLTRSAFLVRQLNERSLLPAAGRMMDFGCGIGNFLRSFGGVFKEWTLAGFELSDAQRQKVESIERVEHLYTGSLAAVPGQFDLITMIHALEHIESPLNCLREIRAKLKPGGLILVVVPDCAASPFSLLVADHCSHFCLPVLQSVMQNAGFEIVTASNQLIAKEITIIGRIAPEPPAPRWGTEGCMDATSLGAAIDWLRELSAEARRASTQKPFGIFGTSIAATFLVGELGDSVDFYVDEDPGRRGQLFNGRPIYAPTDVPCDAHIFIGLPPFVAARILDRMKSLNTAAQFYPPPPYRSSARS